jgi:hypothetical protein
MVDVTRMPAMSFGHVPTPAIVAPIEFTMRLSDYEALGGHMAAVRPLEQALAEARYRILPSPACGGGRDPRSGRVRAAGEAGGTPAPPRASGAGPHPDPLPQAGEGEGVE